MSPDAFMNARIESGFSIASFPIMGTWDGAHPDSPPSGSQEAGGLDLFPRAAGRLAITSLYISSIRERPAPKGTSLLLFIGRESHVRTLPEFKRLEAGDHSLSHDLRLTDPETITEGIDSILHFRRNGSLGVFHRVFWRLSSGRYRTRHHGEPYLHL